MQPGESAGAQGALLRKRADGQRAAAAETLRRAAVTDHQADRYERGQLGEQVVGAALDGLREHGYEVLHDVRWPGRRRANIDHVAVGPAGILVVDAKNWTGKVSAHHGILRQNGNRRDKQVDGVRRAGADVASQLQLPWALHVIPVLCLAGEHQLPPSRCGQVTVVDVGRLPGWVSALPGHLSPREVLGLAGELRSKLPSVGAAVPRQPRRRRAARPDRRFTDAAPKEKTAWQRERPARRTAAAKAALLKLTLLLVLLLALPTLMHVWSTAGPDLFGTSIPTPNPAAAAPRVTPVYASCSKLRAADHPGGVASPGAKNTGRKLRQAVAVTTSQLLYAANARLDTDADHIACEVVRKRPNKH
jgi:hypothetical protein